MKSTKCPQCGLVYWTTAPNCKRCGLATEGYEGENSATASQDEPQPQFGAPHEAAHETQQYSAEPNYPRTPSVQPGFGNDIHEEELLRNLTRDTRVFYFIGGLQVLLWFIVGNLLIFDAVFNIGLAFVAYKFKSRVAAILLSLLTLLSVMVGVTMIAAGAFTFNPIAIVVLLGRLFTSGRIVYTTFMLNKYFANEFQAVPPPPPVFHQEGGQQWASPAASTDW